MPELPEVETIARGLRIHLVGLRVFAAALFQPSIFSGEELLHLEATRLDQLERAGKYLIFTFAGGKARWQLMIHLGMTGQLLVYPVGQPRARHTHAIFYFDNGAELHFRDPRRFGRIALARAPKTGFAPALKVAPGLEPLAATPDEFVRLFQRRQAPIKNSLMNQKLLRGVGNIYADESLFRAGISPLARSVSAPRLLRLRAAIQEVLSEAIAAGGSSISDYLDSTGEPGTFHLDHRVYARTGEPCLVCGAPIRRKVLAGRSAHYCPKCQNP